MDPQTAQEIQLISIQMKLDLRDYWTQEAFAARIRAVMDQVQQVVLPDIPTLVAFPEDVGLLLVLQGMERLLSPAASIEDAIGRAVRAQLLPLMRTRLTTRLAWVPALLYLRHRLIADTYFSVFSEAASRHRLYIAAGTVVLPPYTVREEQVIARPTAPKVHNTAYLFGPDGGVLGHQHKVHLIDLEQEAALHLHAGTVDELTVFDTALGRIGIAICYDAFQDDVVDRLVELDADILVQPSANPGPWHEQQQAEWMQSSHRQTAVCQKFAYALNPMLVGPLWDIAFYGQSGILSRRTGEKARTSYTQLPETQGFVALARSADQEEILTAVLPHPDQSAD